MVTCSRSLDCGISQTLRYNFEVRRFRARVQIVADPSTTCLVWQCVQLGGTSPHSKDKNCGATHNFRSLTVDLAGIVHVELQRRR